MGTSGCPKSSPSKRLVLVQNPVAWTLVGTQVPSRSFKADPGRGALFDPGTLFVKPELTRVDAPFFYANRCAMSGDKTLTALLDRLLQTTEHNQITVQELVDAIGHRACPALILVPALIITSPVSGIPGVSALGGLMVWLN